MNEDVKRHQAAPRRASAEVIDQLPEAIPVYRRTARDLPGLVAKEPDRVREQLRR